MRFMMRRRRTSIRCSLYSRCKGRSIPSALQAAVQALIGRHASLRAVFQHESLSRPVQVIVPKVVLPWRTIDLSLLNGGDREQRLAAASWSKIAPSASILPLRRSFARC